MGAGQNGEPEVDYVITLGETRIPIEVKYRAHALTESNLYGLRSFVAKKDNHAPFGIMITRTEPAVFDTVVAIPARRFLLLG